MSEFIKNIEALDAGVHPDLYSAIDRAHLRAQQIEYYPTADLANDLRYKTRRLYRSTVCSSEIGEIAIEERLAYGRSNGEIQNVNNSPDRVIEIVIPQLAARLQVHPEGVAWMRLTQGTVRGGYGSLSLDEQLKLTEQIENAQ